MNAAPQFRSTEESGEKPEFHPRRNGEQSYLREAHLLPETVNPSRWWGLELRRIWSFLFFTVVVALLALGTMGGRATGYDAPAVSVFTSGEELGDVGTDRAALSRNSTHGGRRTTDVQEVRSRLTSVDHSDSPDIALKKPATVSDSSAVVPKTHFSDVFRLVFVAGLEGTGHHYIVGTNASLFGDDRNLPRRGRHRIKKDKYYAPEMMGGAAENFTRTSDEAIADMRRLADWAASLSWPGTLEFISISCSYPLNAGPLKVMQYLDMRRMAETAEGEGVDFRVLYLRRPAKDMVIANTVHRKIHRYMGPDEGTPSEEELFVKYMRVLFTDIAVLQSFLTEIGPEFVVCHDWDHLGGKEQASTIANFISPNDEIAGLVASSLVQTARKSSSMDTVPFKGSDALVSRLQRKLDVFEPLYCD